MIDPAISFIGFGEAGGLLGGALAARAVRVTMYDRQLDDARSAPAMRDKAARLHVAAASSLAAAIRDTRWIVSAVTASSDAEVAAAVATHIRPGQTFVDINSVSPALKQHGQRLIEAAGGRYVEAAVMAPVPPHGLAVPMLLAGPAAEAVSLELNALGFDAQAVSTRVGVASAAKMCRSVMIKGIEALTVECLGAARAYGADALVLASLRQTFDTFATLPDLPGYLIGRVAEHGRRRAAEMREVCDTLREGGVAPEMSDACARVQDGFIDRMAARGLDYHALLPFDWQQVLDRLDDRLPSAPASGD
ncbi:6-phosphogluconate dehydrogenase [Burkholderia diffusa]|uniref:6-phosphogluconate dehydrogenase n=1 Tax=Burkholderia diffusa TaxID=488732 RepID=A0AAW3PJJ6_9BURK|nr:NAD(P)-dependent oxidoreductase [Burkholderia diffusa]KWF34133.1 6-phosphogluconate dehydrogenase [Burkholderia diffusa]KWF40234.1 6-phosphogluconate dehydrogenase [Burkholderia diffusa]KWF46366.1 6-phosphogluconate dehydrogenase [Burkholderia diffusa]KWF56566.1 6-phosphogluconate dehydrogenase [Burkholderia diffusa]